MEFTAKDVMALRERSGAGMMDCKKALKECDGDIEKALDYLREKSLAASAKKASRIAAEGIVDCFVCEKCGVGVIIEVNCETDFVAKTDDFKNLVASLAKHVAKKNPASVEDMMAQSFSEDESKTVSDVINGAVAKIGERSPSAASIALKASLIPMSTSAAKSAYFFRSATTSSPLLHTMSQCKSRLQSPPVSARRTATRPNST